MNTFRLTEIFVHIAAKTKNIFMKASTMILVCTVIFCVMFGFAVKLLCIQFSFLGLK